MKKVTLFIIVCLATFCFGVAHAGQCNGKAMVVFMPAVPDQISFMSIYGDVVIVDCTTGSPGLHRCICITGQQVKSCTYVVTAQAHFELGQSGGCAWRNIDGVCWCVDISCGNTGEEPVQVAPLQ